MSDGYNLIGNAGTFCDLSGDMSGMQYGTAGYTLDPQLGPLAAYTDLRNYYLSGLVRPGCGQRQPRGLPGLQQPAPDFGPIAGKPPPVYRRLRRGLHPALRPGRHRIIPRPAGLFLPLLAK